MFKKIFDKFMEWMDSYYTRDYLKQIKTLKKEKKELGIDMEILKTELVLEEQKSTNLKKDLDQCIIELLSFEEPEVEKPSWLTGHMKYRPRRRFVSKTMDVVIVLKKPQHCFDKATVLYDLLKEKELYKVEKTYDNMKKIHKLISNWITYEYDKTDNWRSISDIIIFKYGDCDDSGGIAITSALGMAGWKADEVFVSVGWYYPKGKSVDPNNKFCHAWCKAKCEGKWYILEGTNPRAIPRLWKDWKDKYVENLGCCNWKFEGMIKDNKTYL